MNCHICNCEMTPSDHNVYYCQHESHHPKPIFEVRYFDENFKCLERGKTYNVYKISQQENYYYINCCNKHTVNGKENQYMGYWAESKFQKSLFKVKVKNGSGYGCLKDDKVYNVFNFKIDQDMLYLVDCCKTHIGSGWSINRFEKIE